MLCMGQAKSQSNGMRYRKSNIDLKNASREFRISGAANYKREWYKVGMPLIIDRKQG